ncbi:MAG TPA: alpha-E domain-containing protein [Acidimicrobiales bacterium]|nr:alpha-E domain-containing protein [Acidimicrobiales bacterium]
MLARHAENLYWAGRYLERAEDAARLLDVTYHGQLQAMPWETDQAWSDLVSSLGLDADFEQTGAQPTAASVSHFIMHSAANQSSIETSVARARENIRAVREMVPTELWEGLNTFYLELSHRDLGFEVENQPHAVCAEVKRRCQSVAGVAAETMNRDEAWQFLQIGWMLERAAMTCRLLDIRYPQLVEAGTSGGFHLWLATLKSAAGAEAFRRTYRGSISPTDVIDFLLLSDTFPRSVYYCLRSAEGAVRRIPSREGRTRPERLLGQLRSELEYVDLQELVGGDAHTRLEQIRKSIEQIGEAVAIQFFRNSEEHALLPLDRRVRF